MLLRQMNLTQNQAVEFHRSEYVVYHQNLALIEVCNIA